jgi:hypothetical protein
MEHFRQRQPLSRDPHGWTPEEESEARVPKVPSTEKKESAAKGPIERRGEQLGGK